MKGVSAQWNIFSLFQTPSIPLGRGFEKEKISGSAIRKNENNIPGLKLVVQQKGSIIQWLKIADKYDERTNLIYLIAQGKSLKKTTVPILNDAYQKAIDGISDKDILICKDFLNRVFENLKDLFFNVK